MKPKRSVAKKRVGGLSSGGAIVVFLTVIRLCEIATEVPSRRVAYLRYFLNALHKQRRDATPSKDRLKLYKSCKRSPTQTHRCASGRV